MGWRFRKSIKIAPGVKLNFNKKSIGITFGGKGAHYTINSKGQRTSSVGIPGTGISYSTSTTKRRDTNKAHANNASGKGAIIITFIIMFLFVGCTLKIMHNQENQNNISTVATIETTMESSSEEETFAVMYTTSSLNVRSGPGVDYDIIDTLDSGTKVIILDTSEKWAEIRHDKSPAYVSTAYLSSYQEAVTTIPKTEDEGPMVWISYSGNKYHSKSSCSGMKGAQKVTLKEAQQMGKTPCSKCY